MRDAQRCGVPLTDATFLQSLDTDALRQIVGGSGTLPMLDERRQILNELGRSLNKHYRSQVSNLIELAGGSAGETLSLLLQHFPSFRDVSTLDGCPVYFLKRAQIFVSDLWLVFGGESVGRFDDIDTLTAFADYKLPQFLRAAGVLAYDDHLAAMVDAEQLLPNGSREEVEIRAATVQAVERLRDMIARRTLRPVFTCKLDNCLWALSQNPELSRSAPPHRTRTIYY